MALRVIHSFPNWLPQTQTWMHTQVNTLPRTRIEPHVVCEQTEHLDQFSVDHLHVRGGPGSWRFWSDKIARAFGSSQVSPFLVGTIRKLGARVVHSHFANNAWLDMPSVAKAGARHIFTTYGYDISSLPVHNRIWEQRYRELFMHVDRVLCEGTFMAATLQRLGCPREKIRVHHLGVDLTRLRFAPRQWTPGEPLRVLIAASFTEKKGIPDALQALAHIRQEIPLEVTIIGDSGPHYERLPEKQRILQTIEENGLNSIVRLLGYQAHAKLLEEAYTHHILLSPSRTAANGDSEGGAPVTIIEMAAIGMFVVSTRHCDIPSVVIDGETGLLADEGDVDGLCDHLRWLIRNPEVWASMRKAGRRHVEAEFDAQLQASTLAGIYEELAR